MTVVSPSDLVDEHGHTERERTFCAAYLAHGFNAAAAYRIAFPDAAPRTVQTEAAHYRAKPSIRRYLEEAFERSVGKLEVLGNEMLGRVLLDARADIRDAFDQDGTMLPPHLWPDRLVNSIEGIEYTGAKRWKIKLVSKPQARRLLLEQTGKLKNPMADQVSALARAIRGDLGLEEGAA